MTKLAIAVSVKEIQYNLSQMESSDKVILFEFACTDVSYRAVGFGGASC